MMIFNVLQRTCAFTCADQKPVNFLTQSRVVGLENVQLVFMLAFEQLHLLPMRLILFRRLFL